jgi:hypothetical protein
LRASSGKAGTGFPEQAASFVLRSCSNQNIS